jgi:hypothetical protein
MATFIPKPFPKSAEEPAPIAVSPTALCRSQPWTEAFETGLRRKVVEEAMTWVNTPYMQLQDVKGRAVDCSMLLVRCWVDTGILEPFDPRPYSANWHMHKDEEKYLGWMETLGVEITRKQIQIGDIMMFQFGKCFAHAGIISEIEPSTRSKEGRVKLIHAHSFVGKVARSWSDYPVLKYVGRTVTDSTKLRPFMFYSVFAKIKTTVSPLQIPASASASASASGKGAKK